MSKRKPPERNLSFGWLRLSRNYSFADKQEQTAGRSKVVRKFLPMVETFFLQKGKSQIHAPAFYEFAQQILFHARCRAIEVNFNFFDKLNPCISQEIHGFLLRQHRTIKAAVLCGNFVL